MTAVLGAAGVAFACLGSRGLRLCSLSSHGSPGWTLGNLLGDDRRLRRRRSHNTSTTNAKAAAALPRFAAA